MAKEKEKTQAISENDDSEETVKCPECNKSLEECECRDPKDDDEGTLEDDDDMEDDLEL